MDGARSRRCRGGFSLIELTVAGLILATVAFVGVVALRGTPGKTGAHGLALMLAEEFRLASQKAVADQIPVAVVVPSAGGSVPHAQSVYIVEGQDQPRITRVANYAGDFPQAVAFVGSWGSPGLAASTGSKFSGLDLDRWIPDARQSDYYFLFTPDGGVLSNDLPVVDGCYHVVAAAGVRYATGGAPTGGGRVANKPTYFSLQAAGSPFTVRLSPGGSVTVVQGIPSAPGVALESSLSLAATPAGPPVAGAGSPTPPEMVRVEVLPQANPDSLPTGVDVTCDPDGFLTLNLWARDDDGGPIYVEWTASDGRFSFPGAQRMVWDDEAGLWFSSWQWRPPLGAVAGQRYQISCAIGDVDQTVMIPLGPALTDIELVDEGRIAFEREEKSNAWPHNHSIYLMNADGTGETLVLDRGDVVHDGDPRLSRDGSKLIYNSGTSWWQGLDVANSDGSNPVEIVPDSAICGSFSPNGDRVAYWSNSGAGFTLCTANADGTNVQQWYNVGNAIGHHTPSWSADGTMLSFKDQGSVTSDLRVVDVTTGAVTSVAGPGASSETTWSQNPADPWVYYAEGGEIWRVRPDGTSRLQATNFAGAVRPDRAYLNPAGDRLLLEAGSSLYRSELDGSNLEYLTTTSDDGSWGE